MKTRKLGIALAATMLAAVPFASFAQEAEDDYKPFSATLAATSDYVWRGISQTNEDPAFQAGVTYTSKVGIYAGAWTSNVDFGAGDVLVCSTGLIGVEFKLGGAVPHVLPTSATRSLHSRDRHTRPTRQDGFGDR